MPCEPMPADANHFDVSSADIDAAIEACDGDARGAIRALLIAYATLEHEMSAQVSRGYRRQGGSQPKARSEGL